MRSEATRPRRNGSRLSSWNAYRPLEPSLELAPEERNRLLRDASEADRRAAAERTRAAFLRAASLYLELGLPEAAVSRLETAVVEVGGPILEGDLAAAQLAMGEQQRRPTLLLEALQSLERLGGLGAGPTVLFNLALAYESTGMLESAGSAWRDFLADCDEPDWCAEGQRRLDRLVTDEQRWSAALEATGWQSGAAQELTRRFPLRARRLAEEELLPLWADQVLAADPAGARETRRALEETAIALSDRGEHLLSTVLESLPTAGLEETASRATLEALQLYGRAVAMFERQQTDASVPLFERVAEVLEPISCPIALWADFYAALATYYGDVPRGRVLMDDLAGRAPAARYPALAGRIRWIQGTIANVESRPEDAAALYGEAQALLETGSGPAEASFMHVELAGALTRAGDLERAWSHRFAAMESVPWVSQPRRRMAYLLELAQATATDDGSRLSQLALQELTRLAELSGNDWALATTFMRRAHTSAVAGMWEEALAEVVEGRRHAEGMPEGALREATLERLLFAEGLALRRIDPERALRTMEEALSPQMIQGEELRYAEYLGAAVEIHGELGRAREQAQALFDLVDRLDPIVLSTEDRGLRRALIGRSRGPIELLLAEHDLDDPEALLRLADRLRGRQFLASRAGWDRPGTSWHGRLGDQRVVHYTSLQERLLITVVDGSSTTSVAVPTPRRELEARLRRLWASEAAWLPPGGALEWLYEQLVRPVEDQLPAGEPLVLVPDWVTARVPFLALWDARERTFFGERWPLSLLSSLAAFEQAPACASIDPQRTVVVGAGATSSTAAPGLSVLELAEEEALRVREFWKRGRLLLGPDATPERLLALLPAADMVHFSGHAKVNPIDASASRLLLGPSSDGRRGSEVTFAELAGAGASEAEVLVFSSCNTMDSIDQDRDNPLGIGGYLNAEGATWVLAPISLIEDRDSYSLMVAVQGALREGLRPPEAVQQVVASRREEPRLWGNLALSGWCEPPAPALLGLAGSRTSE